jgi:tRNA (guanine-N7-)-methyltransferase
MIDLDLDTVGIPLVWSEIFGREAPTDIEIGSGKGKFLNEIATLHPERNLLAVERSPKYQRLCCDRVARRGLDNVRLVRTTGEDLLFRLLAAGSVQTFFVLFPDPWPKKRHHKRRFIKPEVVAAIGRALVPGGSLLVKSDHDGYADVIGDVLANAPGFEDVDPARAFAGLPVTGFEVKYIAGGRTIHSFAIQKSIAQGDLDPQRTTSPVTAVPSESVRL